jgi:hypothetical protein
MSKSVLCLFVKMKRLQNEISRISANLIQNLKIKIISISVLNWYFLSIASSVSNRYRIVSYWFLALIFPSRPSLTATKLVHIIYLLFSGALYYTMWEIKNLVVPLWNYEKFYFLANSPCMFLKLNSFKNVWETLLKGKAQHSWPPCIN